CEASFDRSGRCSCFKLPLMHADRFGIIGYLKQLPRLRQLRNGPIFLYGAATPPSQGGDWSRPQIVRNRRDNSCDGHSGATMRRDLLRFNGAVERDPTIDAWMKDHAGELGAIAEQWFEVMRM